MPNNRVWATEEQEKKDGKPKTYMGKSTRPGGGGSFAMMENALERKGFSEDSARAITASRGIKKYGKSKMAKWSAAGRKRAAAKRAKS